MLPDSAPPTLSRRGLRLASLTAAAVAIAVVTMGITTRKMADARLSQWTEDQAVPSVAVAMPDARARTTSIDLPGRLEAYSQAQIFARVSGYIKSWKADIGTPVKTGQLLAEIDAPDLDQQIMQSQANLASAQANATLSRATLERGQSLIPSGAISKQDLDPFRKTMYQASRSAPRRSSRFPSIPERALLRPLKHPLERWISLREPRGCCLSSTTAAAS